MRPDPTLKEELEDARDEILNLQEQLDRKSAELHQIHNEYDKCYCLHSNDTESIPNMHILVYSHIHIGLGTTVAYTLFFFLLRLCKSLLVYKKAVT